MNPLARTLILAALRYLEGEILHPYPDDAGIPTIGVGCTSYEDGRAVTLADPPITEARSEALLNYHVDKGAARLQSLLGNAPTTPNQFVALLVCGFNIGFSALASSTILRKHIEQDYPAAALAFALWNKVRKNGKLVSSKGLTNRRAYEEKIYTS